MLASAGVQGQQRLDAAAVTGLDVGQALGELTA